MRGGHLTLHSRNGRLNAAHSRIIDGLNLAVDKPMPEQKALEVALADHKLILSDVREHMPKGELVLTNIAGDYVKENYRLAYYFDIYGNGKSTDQKDMREPGRVYVDATTGKLIKTVPLLDKCFGHDYASPLNPALRLPDNTSTSARLKLLQTATFNSLHPRSNPTPSFEVEPAPQGGFRLTMSTPTVAQALQTRWDQNNNFFSVLNSSPNPNLDDAWDDPDLTNSTLNWGNNVPEATLAHWTTWRAYQYFKNRFGMNGTDGQGGIGRILITPSYQNNASWNRDKRMMFLGIHTGTYLSAVDIVAHEYGHGVSSYLVAGWWATNPETSALNEGFSDIIGTTIERELYPTGGQNDIWNYRIGEDAWLLRDMADPHSIVDPLPDGFGIPRNIRYPQTYQEPGFWIPIMNHIIMLLFSVSGFTH